MNIFEQLNLLLLEANNKSKYNDIPIHPEMETKEQGINAAIKKYSELVMNIKYGGGGDGGVDDGAPEIPDNLIDPILSKKPEKTENKTFKENKLVGWDEEEKEKIKKEVEVDNDNNEKSEDKTPYDSFDYEENDFGGDGDDGDESNEEYDEDENFNNEDGNYNENENENDYENSNPKEKLKQGINDAFDAVEEMEEKRNPNGGNNKQKGDNQEEYGEDGDNPIVEPGGGSGGDGGENDNNSNRQPQKQQGGNNDNSEGGNGNNGEPGGVGTSGNNNKQENKSKSEIKKRLEDLKKAIESENQQEVENAFEDIKNEMSKETVETDDNRLPGGQIETPSDEVIKKIMEDAGYDENDIKEMNAEKNIDASKDQTEEEEEELLKEIAKEMENHSMKTKGTSSSSSKYIKNALEHRIKSQDWVKIIKRFLTTKVGRGGKPISKNNKGLKTVNKRLVAFDIYPPAIGDEKKTKSKLKKIYCFVDCSGSVEEKLVKTLLGLIINMFTDGEINMDSTELYVYGFGESLITTSNFPDVVEETKVTYPIKIDAEEISIFKKQYGDMFKENLLTFIWEKGFETPIQMHGEIQATENFRDVIKEINKIKRNDKDTVFLIFGDALWCKGDQNKYYDPSHIKEDIDNNSYLDDICVLTYYENTKNGYFKDYYIPTIKTLKKQGINPEHIITTQLENSNLKGGIKFYKK